jgi:LEA14-like dessication related protein
MKKIIGLVAVIGTSVVLTGCGAIIEKPQLRD